MPEQIIGSRAQVWHGTAVRTAGGLEKADLMMNERGRLVSRKKHSQGKKAIKHLFDAGFKPSRGSFKLFRKSDRATRSRTKTKKPLKKNRSRARRL